MRLLQLKVLPTVIFLKKSYGGIESFSPIQRDIEKKKKKKKKRERSVLSKTGAALFGLYISDWRTPPLMGYVPKYRWNTI